MLRKMLVSLTLGLLITAFAREAPAAGNELTIAAAADLNYAFKDLVTEFERQTGTHVKLSLGSSGNFFSQISNGAPFDLYFSADIGYPKKLIVEGFAVPNSLYQYATGRIVLWVPNTASVAVEKAGIQAVADPAVKKIAIANPKHAPYGRAAVAALRHFKLYDRVKDKLVFGENITQAAQFVESGAADIGIIALSLALAPAMKAAGSYWEIPAEAHQPLEQGAVVLKDAKNAEAAKKFLDFMQSAAGQAIMRRYGFVLPDGSG